MKIYSMVEEKINCQITSHDDGQSRSNIFIGQSASFCEVCTYQQALANEMRIVCVALYMAVVQIQMWLIQAKGP